MSAVSITTELDEPTLVSLRLMASDRGISLEKLASESIRQSVAENAALSAAIREGREQIAAGQGLTHEELVTELRAWRKDRKYPA